MSFIGQIRLADLKGLEASDDLPPDGLLSFFYDSAQSTWGFDPNDVGSAAVMWFPESIDLGTRVHPPEVPPDGCFERVDASFENEWTVPPIGSIELPWHGSAALPAGAIGAALELEQLMALEELLGGPESVRHRIFGFADQIQNEMRTEAELVATGVSTGAGWPLDATETAQLEAKARIVAPASPS